MSPRRNWGLSHPLSRQRVCPPPPNQRGEGTLACGRGVGGVPIPTTGEKAEHSAYSVIFIYSFYLFSGSDNLTSALAELQAKMLDLDDMKTKQFRIQTVTQFMQLFKQREGCTFFLFCPIL
jgi:hypothetical protein